MIGRERPARIGEVHRAVGFDDDIVGTQQAFALEAVGDDSDAAVGVGAGDTTRQMLGRDDAALQIAGEAVSLVSLLHRDGDALTRRVFHAARGIDVVEEQVTAFLPPERSFGRTDVAAETLRQFDDGLNGVQDAGELRRHRSMRRAAWAPAGLNRFTSRRPPAAAVICNIWRRDRSLRARTAMPPLKTRPIGPSR